MIGRDLRTVSRSYVAVITKNDNLNKCFMKVCKDLITITKDSKKKLLCFSKGSCQIAIGCSYMLPASMRLLSFMLACM